MIVWRGWGLPILFVAVVGGALVATLVANITGGTTNGNAWSIADDAYFAIAAMLAVAGLICFALGWRLNIVSAEARARAHADEVRTRLVASMSEGTLQVSPGVAPSSQAEAEAFIEQTVTQQHAEARSALRNRHSVFFIPIQYIGALGLAGAIAVFVYAVITALV